MKTNNHRKVNTRPEKGKKRIGESLRKVSSIVRTFLAALSFLSRAEARLDVVSRELPCLFLDVEKDNRELLRKRARFPWDLPCGRAYRSLLRNLHDVRNHWKILRKERTKCKIIKW